MHIVYILHNIAIPIKTFQLPLYHRLMVAIYIDLREKQQGVWALVFFKGLDRNGNMFKPRTLKHRIKLSDFKGCQVVRTSKCLCIQVSREHLTDAFNTCTLSIEDDCCRCCKLPVRLGSQTWDVLKQTNIKPS